MPAERGAIMARRTLAALAALALPSLAAAAALGTAISEVTGWEWLAVVVLSAFAGLVALFQRVRANQYAIIRRQLGEPYEDADIIRVCIALYAASHMGGALLAGVLAFFLGVPVLPNGHAIAASIALSAYGGARVVERMAARNGLLGPKG